jgi:hypothetical protein
MEMRKKIERERERVSEHFTHTNILSVKRISQIFV